MKYENVKELIDNLDTFLTDGSKYQRMNIGKRRFTSLQILNEVFIQDHISVNDDNGIVTVSTLNKELNNLTEVKKFINNIKELYNEKKI